MMTGYVLVSCHVMFNRFSVKQRRSFGTWCVFETLLPATPRHFVLKVDYMDLFVRGLPVPARKRFDRAGSLNSLNHSSGCPFACFMSHVVLSLRVWASGQGEGQWKWWTSTADRDCSMAGQPILRMSQGADYKEPRGHLPQLCLCFVALFLHLDSLPKH